MQNRAYNDGDLLEKVRVLSLHPGDILVVSTAQNIPSEIAERIKDAIKSVVGDFPILLLNNDLEIAAIRKERVAESG